MTTIKICVIADQIYKSGGIERVLSHRINHWIKCDYDVHLITSENEGNSPYFFYDSKMIHHDIDSNFDKSLSLFSSANLAMACKYFFKLKKILNKISPDVIVMTNYNYDYYFIPLIANNIYSIKEYHSSFSEQKNIIGKIKRYYTRFYDIHVFLSQEEKALHLINNSVVIPNPVNMSKNYPVGLSKRRKTIVTAGRIVSIKGFERLIEGWSKIAEKYPDWSLEIYGDGEIDYIESLKLLISKNNLTSSVSIYSSIPDIVRKMLDSRIYAMSSLTECFPMVLLEAMQARMAVIAFDCPTGPRNIIDSYKTGILIEDNNIHEFADALERLINNEALAQELADNGFIESQQYDTGTVMKKWNVLVNKAFSKRQ